MITSTASALLQVVIPPMPPGMGGPHIPFEVVMIAKSFFTTIACIALGIPAIRALSRRFLERPPVAPALPPELAMRLERIEQTVDSIAIEVERVSEGQRFTTKMLAEGRGALPGGGTPGATVSPTPPKGAPPGAAR